MRSYLPSRNPTRWTAALAGSLLLAACSDLPLSLEPPRGPIPVGSGIESPAAGPNPVRGARLYVDPNSAARKRVEAWRRSRPGDAATLEKIASQPQAIWLGDWIAEPYGTVRDLTERITAAGALPVYVLYSIPQRDCGHYSAGGAPSAGAYRRCTAEVARGIGERRALVVLEPDALAGMDCLSPSQQEERVKMLRQAVRTLKSASGALVYIDAGNAVWHPAERVAERLRRVGIAEADGFALNVSHYVGNDLTIPFGQELSGRLGGKHFVIDTSRNGAGRVVGDEWCNLPGKALGARPTTDPGHARVDAFLWIKNPGESDGECNGGPPAGTWWAEYALGLAMRARW